MASSNNHENGPPAAALPADIASVLAELESAVSDSAQQQEEVLAEILRDNASCEYLQKHGLGGRTDKLSFKSCLPIVAYADIEPYIQRIADGDSSPILFTYDVVEFGLSTGTAAGKSKLIPITAKAQAKAAPYSKYVEAIFLRDYPGAEKGKILSLNIAGQQTETKSGHKVGGLTTNALRNEKHRQRSSSLKRITSPIEVLLCSDGRQAIYCHLLCGLLQRTEVKYIEALFAFLVASAFRVLEERWQELSHDIRSGTLSETVKDPDCRQMVSSLLRPDAELAETIERECSQLSWCGIIRRLWPNAEFLSCHASGPVMRPYIPVLNHYSADLPIVMNGYAATEGLFLGLNLDQKASPYNVAYTLLPFSVFFEFIPFHKEEEIEGATPVFIQDMEDSEINLGTLELHELQVGHYYEILVTSFQGLYRYRLGDILRVTGFYKSCPMMELVCRKNVLLGLNLDKTDEVELEVLMGKAGEVLRKHGMGLAEYTSYADHSTKPGHYVIFWELLKGGRDEVALRECCQLLDSSLNIPYQRGRKDGTIGPLELRVVKAGTFAMMIESAVKRGASVGQYKPPRCITSQALVELMNNGVAATFYSSDSYYVCLH